jgi:mono/diheme cytochrome c family protein
MSTSTHDADNHEHGDAGAPAGDKPEGGGELYGVLAEFDSPGALVKGARKVKDAGYADFDCYSPFPVHGIDDAMGIKRTILPVVVFGAGITGTGLGLLMQWWMNSYDWPWNVGGKPTWSIPANIPIAYETTILLSVLTTFFGMWIFNKLPQVWHPFFRLDRFTKASDDGFLLGIEAKDKRFDLDRTTELLKKAGATAVEPCYHDPDPAKKQMPKWIYAFIAATTVMAMIPLALILKARASKSTQPHWHVIADMDFQPKFKSDNAFAAFPDGRANRGEIAGTVSTCSPGSQRPCDHDRHVKSDTAMYQGIEGSEWITGLPRSIEPTAQRLARGKERYDIFCAPCHGFDGKGAGIVPARVQKLGGAWAARDLTDVGAGVVTMPNGQLFNTISNGFATMMGYSSQIPVDDRWSIVLYVRALQRSQNATLDDVPADQRGALR